MLRKGICAIIFKRNKKIKFLIFHRIQNWRGWEFLKGGIKDNETERRCLEREIREETGLKRYRVCAKPNYIIRYAFSKPYEKDGKIYTSFKQRLYLIEVFDDKVKIDRTEHNGFKWLPKEKVLSYLTWDNQKEAFFHVLEKYFKDTAGPSVHVLIKLLGTLSITFGMLFATYGLIR